METIAQQLEVTDFPFEIIDKNGNCIYYEEENGYWVKYKYDSEKGICLWKTSNGNWAEKEVDNDGKVKYYGKYKQFFKSKKNKGKNVISSS